MTRGIFDNIDHFFLAASRGKINDVYVVHKFGKAEDMPTSSYSNVWDGTKLWIPCCSYKRR